MIKQFNFERLSKDGTKLKTTATYSEIHDDWVMETTRNGELWDTRCTRDVFAEFADICGCFPS